MRWVVVNARLVLLVAKAAKNKTRLVPRREWIIFQIRRAAQPIEKEI
jgi:hypothetical protein